MQPKNCDVRKRCFSYSQHFPTENHSLDHFFFFFFVQSLFDIHSLRFNIQHPPRGALWILISSLYKERSWSTRYQIMLWDNWKNAVSWSDNVILRIMFYIGKNLGPTVNCSCPASLWPLFFNTSRLRSRPDNGRAEMEWISTCFGKHMLIFKCIHLLCQPS